MGKDWLKRLSKEHEGYVTQWLKPWTVPRVLAPRACYGSLLPVLAAVLLFARSDADTLRPRVNTALLSYPPTAFSPLAAARRPTRSSPRQDRAAEVEWATSTTGQPPRAFQNMRHRNSMWRRRWLETLAVRSGGRRCEFSTSRRRTPILGGPPFSAQVV